MGQNQSQSNRTMEQIQRLLQKCRDVQNRQNGLNVLFIGDSGSGKSALATTFCEAILQNGGISHPFEIGTGITRAIRKFQVNNQIALIDSPGIDWQDCGLYTLLPKLISEGVEKNVTFPTLLYEDLSDPENDDELCRAQSFIILSNFLGNHSDSSLAANCVVLCVNPVPDIDDPHSLSQRYHSLIAHLKARSKKQTYLSSFFFSHSHFLFQKKKRLPSVYFFYSFVILQEYQNQKAKKLLCAAMGN